MQKVDLFLFGAGASHGARSVDPPPLGANLHRYVLDYLCLPKAWGEMGILEDPADGTRTEKTRLNMKQRLAGANSYEQLVDQLRRQNERDLLKKLNLLMAYALTPPITDNPKVDNAFAEEIDLYDCFLLKHFPNREMLQATCFITLNYDCLLERALCRCYHQSPDPNELQCLCSRIDYRLSPPQNNIPGIEVLKPHGSINWVPDETLGKEMYVQRPVTTILQGNTQEYTEINAVGSPQHKGDIDIVVAHYAPEKEAQINPGLLKRIRDLSLKRIRQSTTLTIIGVHLPSNPLPGNPSDDPFLHEFLNVASHRTGNGLPVYFVNISDSELRDASSRGFTPIKWTFEEYVNQPTRG
jgi:hypothetical protein